MRRQGFCRSGDVGTRQLAGDDPGIVVLAAKAGKDGAGLGPERHEPSAPNAVGCGRAHARVLRVS